MTNQALANITGAAAELLLEAHVTGTRFGVELGGLFDKATARELETEGFGDVRTECEAHGLDLATARRACECGAGEFYSIFLINDAGTEWLEDAGKI